MQGGRIESLGIYKETEHLLPYHIPASVCGGGGGWRGGCRCKQGAGNMTKPHRSGAFNLADTGN